MELEGTTSGVASYFVKITGGSFGMILARTTATDEASLAEERERIACLLAVNHLPPKALPELSETLSKMFEFYDEKDYSVPTSPISDSVKAIITSEVVHPTFRLDDEL